MVRKQNCDTIHVAREVQRYSSIIARPMVYDELRFSSLADTSVLDHCRLVFPGNSGGKSFALH